MCGIAGAVGPSSDPARLDGALAALRHRGPDSQGVFRFGDAMIGMRRLAIIDVEGGAQPVFDESGTVAAVLNGEIYNYVELREELLSRGRRLASRSDTEVLPHLWREAGVDMFSRLRGMFAIALYDTRRRLLVLARDRMGKKPLKFRLDGERFAFASELRALLPLLDRAPALDRQNLADYLSFGFVPGSPLEGVEDVQPGEWLSFDGRRLERRRWWTLPPHAAPGAEEPNERELRSVVSDAVRIRLRSDVPLGVFLSGGLDSSIVALEAAAHAGADLRAFTVGFGEAPELDESAAAAETARRLGIRHEILSASLDPVEAVRDAARAYGEPFADPSALPTLAVAKAASKRVKVALVGDGGDEIFAGYRRHLAARAFDRAPKLLLGAARALFGGGGGLSKRSAGGFLRRFLAGTGVEFPTRYLRWSTAMLDGPARDELAGTGGLRAPEERVRPYARASELEAFLDADTGLLLPGGLLVKMDLGTMWHSLEARAPFLDVRVIEAARRFPAARHLSGRRGKALLRRAYEKDLPEHVLRGAKRGFEPPLTAWMKGPLKPLWTDLLLGSGSRVGGLFDLSLARRLSEGKVPPTVNAEKVLYALLILELWLRDLSPESARA